MRIFITGKPGCGKTTLILKLVERLRERGYRLGGFITRELRKGGKRIGFEVEDIETGERGMLAHVNLRTPVKVSKYFVNVEEFERIGVRALKRCLEEGKDLVIIDEIGKMELASQEFSNALSAIISSKVSLIATLHLSLVERFREIGKVFHLNRENFEQILEEISQLFQNG